jgi:adenosylhomocysteine nucleosidase
LGHVKPLLVVVGLRAEARIVAGPGLRVVVGGADRFGLAELIERALCEGACGVMSFGLAGGLAPHLRPGATVIAHCVLADSERHPADAGWSRRLALALPSAVIADMAGVDRLVYRAEAKRAMYATTGAVIVDMESHIAARAAQRHGLPFASLRVVADPCDCDLPPVALIAMKPDGNVHIPAVLRSFLERPGQLPSVARITAHTAVALGKLRSARRKMDAFLTEHPRA